MSSRTRSRKQASIGSNHSLRRPTPISASEPRTGNFVLLLVMAWSPPAHNAGNVRVSAPGDYATFNSNHTPDGTPNQARPDSRKQFRIGLTGGARWIRTSSSAPNGQRFSRPRAECANQTPGAHPQRQLHESPAAVDVEAAARDYYPIGTGPGPAEFWPQSLSVIVPSLDLRPAYTHYSKE